MNEVILTGLDGANPLGFLAGVGVVEALTARGRAARLAWRYLDGWRPVVSEVAGVHGGEPAGELDIEGVIALLEEDRRAQADDPALALEYDGKRDLKPAPARFRQYLQELVQQCAPDRRSSVDWAAAFATDVVTDHNGNTKPTALHFTAGQQLFLKMVNELAAGVSSDDLREALVGPWQYGRPLPVMGWDSTAARDYALRASNPSTDAKLGTPGADWLAVRGLASLPVAPVGRRVLTTGCTGGWKSGRFRWALWTAPLTLEMVRSTLGLDVEQMPAGERLARGLGVVLSCRIRRSDQGGYGSFDPATVI